MLGVIGHDRDRTNAPYTSETPAQPPSTDEAPADWNTWPLQAVGSDPVAYLGRDVRGAPAGKDGRGTKARDGEVPEGIIINTH